MSGVAGDVSVQEAVQHTDDTKTAAAISLLTNKAEQPKQNTQKKWAKTK